MRPVPALSHCLHRAEDGITGKGGTFKASMDNGRRFIDRKSARHSWWLANTENVWKCLKKLDDIGRSTPSVSSLDFPPSATNAPLSPRLFGFTLHMQRVTAFAATFSRDSLVQHRFWCLCWPCWSLEECRRSMRPDQIGLDQIEWYWIWMNMNEYGCQVLDSSSNIQ